MAQGPRRLRLRHSRSGEDNDEDDDVKRTASEEDFLKDDVHRVDSRSWLKDLFPEGWIDDVRHPPKGGARSP